MYEEDEVEIPIYLITGFLESGKTSFINFTVAQDYFQIDGPTLLITTEEGEVEYDEKELLKHNTVLEIVEGPDRKSTRLNSSHTLASRMPSSA